jgi:hypothetical protein
MNNPKTQKLPTYSDTSLLVSEIDAPAPEQVRFEYKIEESESTALSSVFNKLFEMVEKNINS